MAERFKGITNQIVETWKSWTKKQKTVLLSAIAAVVIAIGIIVFAVSRPNYQVLTTCKDYSELNSVISLLNENNIQNQVEDNTLVVKVDKNNLTNAKMLIASADVQPDGYTFQDAMESSFTTTESDKTKMYQHYLESKFANDLSLIDGVKSATVTVSIPEASNSFYAVAAETSVAVCLDTSKGISDEVSEGMANFIATAVGNSTTNNITIIDNKGNTLYSGPSNASSNSGVSYAGKLKYKSQIEETTTNKLRRGLLATGEYNEVYLALTGMPLIKLLQSTPRKVMTKQFLKSLMRRSHKELQELAVRQVQCLMMMIQHMILIQVMEAHLHILLRNINICQIL